MKKMQCEVCGSSEIKKIDDTTFECQSCGVQYSKDEVQKLLVEITGEVKIDHSAEVENTIKRAEQYAEEGNNAKAEEYLNKALDMDAENEKAIQRIKEINENKKLSEYSIVAANIDPDENVKSFLKQLAATENIACDIYKEIEITSVKQQYYPSLYMWHKCLYEWSATACHIYYENETVWKDKYNPDTRKTEKSPETKKVKKVNRVPQNGAFYSECNGFGFASTAINDNINTDTLSKNALVECFETLQDKKRTLYKFEKINTNSVEHKDDKIFYNGYEINLNIDPTVFNKKRENILKKGDEEGFAEAEGQVGGHYSENFQAKRKVVAHSVDYLLIPVQIIEYSYKGDTYVAVSDLVSQTTSITMLYPCDTLLVETKEKITGKKSDLSFYSSLGTIGCVVGFVVGAILLFVANNSSNGDLYGIAAMVLWVLSLLGLWLKSRLIGNKDQEFKKMQLDTKENVFDPRNAILSNCYKEFFNVIENNGSFEEAKNAIKDINFAENVNTKKELSEAGNIEAFSTSEATVKKGSGKILFFVGEKHTAGPVIKISIDDQCIGKIKQNEYLAVDIQKNCIAALKWNQAFSKKNVTCYNGKVNVFCIEYGATNLIIKEESFTEKVLDELLKNNDTKTAIECYCIENSVDEKTATEEIQKNADNF